MKLLHFVVSSDIEGSTANTLSIRVLCTLDIRYPSLIKAVIDRCTDPLTHLKALTSGTFFCGCGQRLRRPRPAALAGLPAVATERHRSKADIAIHGYTAVWLMDRGYCSAAGFPGSSRFIAEANLH
jgi:hypothetical protein